MRSFKSANHAYPFSGWELPMDGRQHLYTMQPSQIITVNVICSDKCPDIVWCGGNGKSTQIEENKYQ